MNVLFFTQKIAEADDILGFTCHWVRALAQRVDHVHCLALEVRQVPDFPPNVTVHSLGKERGYGRIRTAWESLRLLHRILSNTPVDVVFAHMAPLYAILSWPHATLRHIPVFTWYTHRQVSVALRIATTLSCAVLTASPESLRLKTSKLIPIGHGIPVDWLSRQGEEDEESSEVLAVARLSPIKRLETFIEAASLLKDKGLRFRIVGGITVSSDRAYRERLRQLALERGVSSFLHFEGSVPYEQIPSYYRQALCTVNACVRSSFDKVVLESMACGKPPLSSNLSFAPLFGEDARY